MKITTFITAALLSLAAGPLFAQTLTYTDPLPFGDQLTNKDQLVQKGISRNGWTYEKVSDQLYLATINHKGYRIKAELAVVGDEAKLKLVDASCDCKFKQENVDGWMVKLRRAIAYEITLNVRDDAMRKKLAM